MTIDTNKARERAQQMRGTVGCRNCYGMDRSCTDCADRMEAAALLLALADAHDDLMAVNQDAKRVARDIDAILSGKEGMAQQASLCDLVEPIRKLKDAHDRMAKDAARYQKVRRLVVDYNQPLQWDGQGKPPVGDMSDWLDCSTDAEFDSAIDAAMGADNG